MRIGESFSRPVFNLSLPGWRRMRSSYAEVRIPRPLNFRFNAAGAMLWGLQRLQDGLVREALREVELRRPIFILGHWRSGTTLLHELLALDDRVISPTTFQCFNPQRFLLTGPSRDAEASRPTGDIVVSASSPQEEEFALLCLGAVSCYEAFLFPAALRDLDRLCDPDRLAPEDAEVWEHCLISFLRGVVHAGGKEKRLLLKSPTNSMRVPRLRKLFPDAVFINLTRQPEAVFASTVRMWETMWERYAIGDPLSRIELEQCVSTIQDRVAAKLEAAVREAAGDRFITITYEDLAADPSATIAKLYRMLELDESADLALRHARYLAEANARRSHFATVGHDSDQAGRRMRAVSSGQ